jgi:ribonuclease BN (tRNA processing enzyme)
MKDAVGHMDVLAVAAAAQACGVRRLIFAHIGRPTAIDRGEQPPFGKFRP